LHVLVGLNVAWLRLQTCPGSDPGHVPVSQALPTFGALTVRLWGSPEKRMPRPGSR
jgi:hypothetical protein